MAALSIEDEETYRLARELADIRGRSLTEVVTQSLRDSLEREKGRAIREDRTDYWLRKGQENRERIRDIVPSTEMSDFLYDDYGLPK